MGVIKGRLGVLDYSSDVERLSGCRRCVLIR